MPIAQEQEGPKYLTLANLLRSQIEKGTLKPGDQLPSFTEMRAQYGATPTTVGRIYAQLEQEQLIERSRGRGTFVRHPPERTRTGIIGIHGVEFHRSSHPYWLRVIEGCYEEAARQGQELLLLNEASLINLDRFDGIITHTPHDTPVSAFERQAHRRMPCVAVTLESPDYPSVLADDYQGAYDLTRHLIQLGHRRIAYMTNHLPVMARRLSGYHDAMREAGITIQPGWIHELETVPHNGSNLVVNFIQSGNVTINNWLKSDWHQLGCTAMLVRNDDTAIGAIQAFQAHGMRVPEDVSVAGYDGTDIGQYFTPRLTTIQVPLRELGAAALDALLRQIRGESQLSGKLMLPVRLLEGDSTREI